MAVVSIRRVGAAGLAVAGSLVVAGATAWACVSGPAVTLSTINAQPGQEVQLSGTNFRQPDPVAVRWNALDGPILATLEAPGSDRTIAGPFTVPATAQAGDYVVIVTQSNAEGKTTQMPIRALITVTPEGATQPVLGGSISPVDADRPVGLVTSDDSMSLASLALIALGVAGLGMFVAGLAALFAGRRGPAPAAARARN